MICARSRPLSPYPTIFSSLLWLGIVSRRNTMGSDLLKGFRMLDLADEKGALCGKMFADMGAEVIKVEPPGGCTSRSIPPFLEDRPGPDRSLYAIAYHAGKK